MTEFNADLKKHLSSLFPKTKFQVERRKRNEVQSICLKWWASDIKELYTIADSILEYITPKRMRFAIIDREQIEDPITFKRAEFIMVEFVGVKLFKSSPWRRD